MIFDLFSTFEQVSCSFLALLFNANSIFELKSDLLTVSVSRCDGKLSFEREWTCFREVTMKSWCFDPLAKAPVTLLLIGEVIINELSPSDTILGLDVENPTPARSVLKVVAWSRWENSPSFWGEATPPVAKNEGVLRFCLK